jgi:aryl-phospho-beta-D-glucosidase BglC (GH1 family)
MKMSIEDYLNCSFEITLCIDEDTMKTVVFEPEWEDDWLTINHGEYSYDLNLWLDDDSVMFAVYRLKQDPDNSPDYYTIIDSITCSNSCDKSSIRIINC